MQPLVEPAVEVVYYRSMHNACYYYFRCPCICIIIVISNVTISIIFQAALLKAIMPPIATDVTVAWSLCTCVCQLMHPAKAVGQNMKQFGKDTCVVPSNILLDRQGPWFPPPSGR